MRRASSSSSLLALLLWSLATIPTLSARDIFRPQQQHVSPELADGQQKSSAEQDRRPCTSLQQLRQQRADTEEQQRCNIFETTDPSLIAGTTHIHFQETDDWWTSTDNENTIHRIPTRHESTVLARRLLALSTTGVLSTIFPADLSDKKEYARVPRDAAGATIALPDYVAACEEDSHPGDVTVLALDVSTTTKNSRKGENVSLAVSWWDEFSRRRGGRVPWSRANLPRMSLLGTMEEMSEREVEEGGIVECFEEVHRDARLWRPGRKGAAHSGRWMRLRVEEVYWIGGFGDRNWIGWFDAQEWREVKQREWEKVRLPGEDR